MVLKMSLLTEKMKTKGCQDLYRNVGTGNSTRHNFIRRIYSDEPTTWDSIQNGFKTFLISKNFR